MTVLLSLAACCGLFGFSIAADESTTETTTASYEARPAEIHWMTVEEALEAQQTEARPLLIDIYTDWCKWCKVQDKETFENAKVVEHIQANYYPVKFDAEQKEAVTFNGKSFPFKSYGKRGVNTFAIHLLGDKLSYPSIVVLDEALNHQAVLQGFQKPEPLLSRLTELETANR